MNTARNLVAAIVLGAMMIAPVVAQANCDEKQASCCSSKKAKKASMTMKKAGCGEAAKAGCGDAATKTSMTSTPPAPAPAAAPAPVAKTDAATEQQSAPKQ